MNRTRPDTVAPPARRPRAVVTRICYLVAAVLVGNGLVSLVIGLATGTDWSDPSPWRVAADFGVGFGLVLAAVCYTATMLALDPRTRAMLLSALAVACAVEVVVATVQAGRGFPVFTGATTTALATELAFAGAPALAGVLIVAAAVALVWAAARRMPGRTAAMTVAVRTGAASFLAATGIGVAMEVATARARAAAGPASAPAGQAAAQAAIPLLPAHLAALAGIGLPLLAGLVARTRYRPDRQTGLSTVACAGYLTAGGVIVVESLLGLPVLTPAGVVIAGLGTTALLTAVVAIGYGLLRTPAQPATEKPTPASSPH